MGNDPDTVPSVWRVDGDSWNNERLYFVTFSFQVKAHLFEYHAFAPSNETANVLTDDPSGFEFPNNPKHVRPEMAVILRSFPSSGLGERLAGEASAKEVNLSQIILFTFEFSDVAMDFCVRPMFLENRLAEWFIFDECVRYVFLSPYRIHGEGCPADATEQVDVPHFFFLAAFFSHGNHSSFARIHAQPHGALN